jgi:cytoskeletal protein CcmA (bactofilin family)
MFGSKKPDPASPEPSRPISSLNAPRPGLPPQQSPAPRPLMAAGTPGGGGSVIGADLTIVGNLQSNGEVQIDGTVQGDLTASRLVIGQHAKITGSLIAEDIVVQGTVMGSIRGNRVTLQSSSKVEGDILHQSLAIEQGAFFEGKSRRTEAPMDARPTDTLPTPVPMPNSAIN